VFKACEGEGPRREGWKGQRGHTSEHAMARKSVTASRAALYSSGEVLSVDEQAS